MGSAREKTHAPYAKMYVNILSLDRCRSTVINLQLSRIFGGYALGEVSRTIDPKGSERDYYKNNPKCSCGENSDRCSFWADILRSSSPVSEYLNWIKNHDFTVIESSKTIKHSRFLRSNICNDELLVLLVVRDFSGWSKSVVKSMQRQNEGSIRNIGKNKGFIFSDIRLYMRRFLVARYFEYMINNLRLMLEARKYSNKRLITQSNDLIDIGLDQSDGYSHILRGNRASQNFTGMKNWDASKCLSVRLLRVVWKIVT